MRPRVDLNCDLGEGAGHDAELMPLITSANIACGAHAGDETVMRATVALARKHGVAIGAHPGLKDREHFGRRELPLAAGEIYQLIRGQIELLRGLGPVGHVKAHGALYNMAARDRVVAEAIAAAVYDFDPSLAVFVLPRSALAQACRERELRCVCEAFADRTYGPDGHLTPRTRPDALIHDDRVAVEQALRMVREGVVRATDGTDISLRVDTVCLHGDGPDPVGFARRLRVELERAGVDVLPVSA